MDYAAIRAAAAARGLIVRGGFHAGPEDEVPPLAGGRPAVSLVLLGNAGPEMWRGFAATPEAAQHVDPLDSWSRRTIGALARQLGAEALFPFGGPSYLPFVRWAKRAEPVAESPLGMLIHPDYGLWHAYRGALAFAGPVALPPADERPRPCDTCRDKPCLSACPVGAFGAGGYDVEACTDHLTSTDGAGCMTGGCLARRACPVGRDYAYEPAQTAFHMGAFLRARLRRRGADAAASMGTRQ